MRIGLVPISAKPYHIGHHSLVLNASKENDKVILFVSTSDRKRKNQFQILGSDMKHIWTNELEPIMPSNVSIKYGGSPVGKVWKTLGDANDNMSNDTYVIYSDPIDTKNNYTEPRLKKYSGDLFARGNIVLAAKESPYKYMRGGKVGTPNVSGTAVRIMLQNKDFEAFQKIMPIGVDTKKIYNILIGTNKAIQHEELIRNMIFRIIM
jgi:Tfp pilus tip-associated adhesin PilY1